MAGWVGWIWLGLRLDEPHSVAAMLGGKYSAVEKPLRLNWQSCSAKAGRSSAGHGAQDLLTAARAMSRTLNVKDAFPCKRRAAIPEIRLRPVIVPSAYGSRHADAK